MFAFARHPSHRPNGLKPGHYAKSLDPRRDRCGWAIVCCPGCEWLFTIGRNHEVTADGAVSPSLVCPYGGCSFHRFVKAGAVERLKLIRIKDLTALYAHAIVRTYPRGA